MECMLTISQSLICVGWQKRKEISETEELIDLKII